MMRPHIESKKGPKKQSLVGTLKFDERKMTKNDETTTYPEQHSTPLLSLAADVVSSMALQRHTAPSVI